MGRKKEIKEMYTERHGRFTVSFILCRNNHQLCWWKKLQFQALSEAKCHSEHKRGICALKETYLSSAGRTYAGLMFPVQTALLKSRLHETEESCFLKAPALCLYILYTYI